MKKQISHATRSGSRITVSASVMLLVIAVTVVSLLGIHAGTEEECWRNLRSAAEAADWQIALVQSSTFADLENAGTMFAESGPTDSPDTAAAVAGSRIGILRMEMRMYFPDGRAYTASGILEDVSDSVRYGEILAALGEDQRYISCVRTDFIHTDMTVMEFFVPVIKDGTPLALLSAVMDLNALQQQIVSNAYNGESAVYCLDTRDGMMFLDNDHRSVYPLSAMNGRKDKNGKSLQPYLEAAMKRQETSTTVMSERYGAPALMYSIPSACNENWEITIVVRESIAFAAEARVRSAMMILAGSEIGLFVLLLIWLLFSVKREKTEMIRKNEEAQKHLAGNLVESLTFTNYFLSTYLAAYYVNLNDCSCQIYKRTEKLEREYPTVDNYYASLIRYINQAVHPDDRTRLTELLSPEKLREILQNAPGYSSFYRDLSGEKERTIRVQIIRGADEDHAAFGFADVTKELAEQRKHLLGAVPVAPDILAKENIGMWAFELDEGHPPRMYGDEAMLRLVGLEHQVPPEEMYRAWYDRIDAGSYQLVSDAVAKMTAGEHAEVQYPWHHPDGHTMVVRCGGVRNPEYTKGIRVEGTHQNVSEVLHFDGEQIRQRRRMNMIYALSDMYDPIMVVDPESGRYEWYEKKADEIEQLTAMSVHGEDFYKDIAVDTLRIIHPDDRARFSAVYNRDNLRHIVETGETQETENRWQVGPNGTYLWKYNKLVRMTDENGRIFVAVGVIDTTEAKEKEASQVTNAILSEYMLQSYTTAYYADLRNGLISILRAPSFMKNAEVSFASQGKVLDYDTLIDYYINNRVHPEDREEFRKYADRAYTRKLLEKDTSFSFNFRDIADYAPGVYRCTVIRGADADHIAAGFQNITDELRRQKERQQELEDANASNRLVLSFVNGIRWSYFINDRDEIYAAKYGDTTTDTYGIGHSGDPMDWVSLLHPDDRDSVLAAFMDAIHDRSGKGRINMTYRLMDTEGNYHWTRVSGQQTLHGDGVRELFGISIDVTDQMNKEREQQKQLAEALSMAESANRAKTTFLNNMSHDIRTPMNAIIGYTGLAAGHIDNKEQVQDYLGKIAQSSDHLLSLINDVLDMSRIESGKMNLDEKPENLSDIIHTLRDIIQADVRAKQLDFFVDAVDVNDEDIICDKLRLNQVLLNILSNAVKYTPAGGTVIMRVREKTVRRSGYGSYEFSVRDNGMGMDEAFIKTIFDPFTRVKSSTVSGIQGTGLGMAITKNIVDMMGGRIDIASAPGKGTEVTVDFDFRLQSAPKVPEEIPELMGVRALIADDNADTCLSICGMVGDIGMRYEWCTSGKEAVIRAEAAYRDGDPFKVFIIDWIMPDMNGIETTRRIRKVIGDDVPIIILTAYDWSDIEEEATEAGVTAFVSKPMFPSDLHRVLNSCLGREEDHTEPEAAEYDFSGRKILLVEDNELNREIATAILGEEGFVIDTAEDGDVAVEKMKAAKAGDYDLVLMDVQMPRMDGYEATRQIRALGTAVSRIPILAMTANAFEEDRKLALQAGMNEHIAKPIDVEKLKKTLAKFLK